MLKDEGRGKRDEGRRKRARADVRGSEDQKIRRSEISEGGAGSKVRRLEEWKR